MSFTIFLESLDDEIFDLKEDHCNYFKTRDVIVVFAKLEGKFIFVVNGLKSYYHKYISYILHTLKYKS